MIALAGSVLAASLVGSAHCAGMCGGIAAFCAGAGECGARRSGVASAAYHLARALSYAATGAAAGAFGWMLDAGGAFVGLQRVAAALAGIAVAIVGVALLMSAGGFDAGRAGLPAWLRAAVSGVHRAAAAMPPVRRAAVLGLATPLLPCGWLWAFALVAAGTGSAAWGAAVMLAFWAGTVPILATVGAGIAALGGARRRALAAIAGVAMVAVGIHTAAMRSSLAVPVAERLAGRAAPEGDATRPAAVRPACCADGASSLPDPPAATAAPKPACCVEGGEG